MNELSPEEMRKQFLKGVMTETYMGFTLECVDICRTAEKDYLEIGDKVCLQNCGYNRMYINKVLISLGNDPNFRL